MQYRFLSRSSSCPLPLPRPTAHGPRPSDPPFAPTGTGLRPKIRVPSAHWHHYPLLAAQALSIAPDSKSRPCVDWCSAPDDRLTRRQAPQNPWDTYWGPQHTSIVLPPRGFEAQALEKMIADKSYGLIFLPNDCAHGLLEHAHAHADVRIELSDHPDARIDPRTSDPIGPTVGMSAFLLPKTGDATRIIPTQVHEVWRTRLPVYQTPLRLEAWTDALKWHPDIEFVHDVIDGIEFGRAMGFRGDRFLQRDCTNPPAHQVHQPVLREIRETELRNGWRAGPFPCRDTPPLFNLMAHPTKAVFKKFSTKIRHVVNISYPHDPSSVNRNIERITRLANVSFEQAASIVAG